MAEPAMTKIHQGFSYRLDPTPEQRRLLAGHMGAARFCHNFLLGLVLDNWEEARVAKEAGHEVTKEHYLGTRQLDLQRLWYERRHEAAAWYQENSSSTYNYAQLHLARAFTNFYQGRSRVPKFKCKGRAESFTVASGATRLVDSHHVRLSRIGEIKTYESMRKLHRHLSRGTGRVTSVTISERRGQYHLAFSVEVTRKLPAVRDPERVIGVDVGISTLYTGATPEGEWVLSVANPRNYQKNEQRLARAQRRASRRQGPRGGVAPSNRWKRANVQVQRIHADITNARKNLIHETTTHLTKNYDLIVIEDLNVKGMLKNHRLAKHISDAAWGEFTRQLEYKAAWYGARVVKADRFFASSKTCSSCGVVKATLPLGVRTFHCGVCDRSIDRDLNAAINLARWASTRESNPTSAGTHSVAGRGGEVRPSCQNYDDTAHPGEASTEALRVVGA